MAAPRAATRQLDRYAQAGNCANKAGFVEGKNLIVNRRFVGARPEQTVASAVELVQLGPDLLMPTGSIPAIVAAQAASRTIPMVGTADDMVASGLAPSLARPDGNLTDVSIMATELEGKRQDILMELVPTCRHMAAPSRSNLHGDGPARGSAKRSRMFSSGVSCRASSLRRPTSP